MRCRPRGPAPQGHDLSNFQGKHACSTDVLMGKPTTVAEVSEVVAAFPRVRANGVGHSWHKELFCAGEDAGSVNVLLHGVRSVLPPTTPASDAASRSQRSLLGAFARAPAPPSTATPTTAAGRAVVDTARRTVKVDAGVKLRDLLDFLANYDDDDNNGAGGDRAPSAGNTRGARPIGSGGGGGEGYTLPSFPWFIDQTMGGAVATATHGSSLRHGSLSSQLTGLTMVLANGTVISVDEDESSPHLFDAARASIGRLGVVVDVTLRIVPNMPVRKTSTVIEPSEFVDMVEAASEVVTRCEETFSLNRAYPIPRDERESEEEETVRRREVAWECAMAAEEVRRLDEMQLFWFFPLGKIVRVEFNRLDMLPDDVLAGTAFTTPPPGRQQHTPRLGAGSSRGAGDIVSAFGAEDDSEVDAVYVDEVQLASVLPNSIAADAGAAGAENASSSLLTQDAAFAENHAGTSGNNNSNVSGGVGGGDGGGSGTHGVGEDETTALAQHDPETLRRLQRVLRRQPSDAPRDVTERFRVMGNSNNSKFWARRWQESTAANVESGIFDARDSYLTMSEEQYDAHDGFGYDQYETCVPLRLAGGCMRDLAEAMVDATTGQAGNLARGFRSQGLLRFVNGESALLSPSNPHASGPCLYINIEDFKRFATEPEEVNEEFQSVVRILRGDSCQGRLHWGKAGWPAPGCFDGGDVLLRTPSWDTPVLLFSSSCRLLQQCTHSASHFSSFVWCFHLSLMHRRHIRSRYSHAPEKAARST